MRENRKMNHMLYMTVIVLMMLMVLCACGNKEIETPADGGSVSGNQTGEGTDNEDQEDEPAIVWYEGKKLSKDIELLATVREDAQAGEKYLRINGVYDGEDDHMLLDYTLSSEPMNYEYFEEYVDVGTDQTRYILPISFQDNIDLSQGIALFGDGSMSKRGYMYLYSYYVDESNPSNYQGFDGNGNELLSYSGTEYLYDILSDGEHYLTVEDQNLVKKSINDPDYYEIIEFSQLFLVDYLNSVVHADDGNDYALLIGRAGDMQKYDAIVNVGDGTFAYLAISKTDCYLSTDNNAFLYSDQSAEDNVTATTICSGGSPVTFTWTGDTYMTYRCLDNHLVLCEWDESGYETGGADEVHFGLYDGMSGDLLGTTTITVDNSGSLWLMDDPITLEKENALLLCMGGNGVRYYLQWNYGEVRDEMAAMSCEPTELPEELVAEVDTWWEREDFSAGECPAELADLRERANQLEEKYQIRIKISNECKGLTGGYIIVPLNEYAQVKDALDMLETELDKYPDGFLAQFGTKGTWVDGLDIYLASTLIGADEYGLDYAGGFQTSTEDSRLLIVLDCSDSWGAAQSIHHELSHAIESLIDSDYENMLDEEAWNAMNPETENGEIYNYSYQVDDSGEYGREEMREYCWSFSYDPESAYFVDSYGLTFPTEDRARLFEYTMMEDSWVDIENSSHLREKMNYYADFIRNGMDSDSWGVTAWEKYK